MLLSAIILCSGISIGIILFQTTVIAPTIFKGFVAEQAGPFLRMVFPKFFIFLAIVGFISAVLSIYLGHTVSMLLSASQIILATSCYVIIPSTNRARDEGKQNRFRLLHFASVSMTLAILVLSVMPLIVL